MMTPNSEEELAKVIRQSTGPLSLRGGNTRNAAPKGEPLSLSGISGIRDYRPEALTLTVAAGTPLTEVEAALAESGQMLPFEPPCFGRVLSREGTSTIGGVIADNASGPRRISAGAARDMLLGVRFTDGTGQSHRFGGPVMKNVSGYDLARLMAGSRGQLGAITEVTLKTLPKPPETAVILLDGLSVQRAVQAMAAALSTPWEVSGAAHLPSGLDGAPVTTIRLEGRAEQIAHRMPALKSVLGKYGPIRIEQRATTPEGLGTEAGWAYVRDLTAFLDKPGDLWRISTRPGHAEELLDLVQPRHAMLDWGGALLWVLTDEGTDLRAKLGSYPGHARIMRADADTLARLPKFEPEPPALQKLATALRKRFDPMGRFSAPELETA